MPNPNTGTSPLYDMWRDLKNKGYFQKDWSTFAQAWTTPGEEGYKIRKSIYDDLHSKGYLQSPTYEEFMRKSGSYRQPQPQRPAQPQATQQTGSTPAGNVSRVTSGMRGGKPIAQAANRATSAMRIASGAARKPQQVAPEALQQINDWSSSTRQQAGQSQGQPSFAKTQEQRDFEQHLDEQHEQTQYAAANEQTRLTQAENAQQAHNQIWGGREIQQPQVSDVPMVFAPEEEDEAPALPWQEGGEVKNPYGEPDNYVERPKLTNVFGEEISEEAGYNRRWRKRLEALAKRDEDARREAAEWARAEKMARELPEFVRNDRENWEKRTREIEQSIRDFDASLADLENKEIMDRWGVSEGVANFMRGAKDGAIGLVRPFVGHLTGGADLDAAQRIMSEVRDVMSASKEGKSFFGGLYDQGSRWSNWDFGLSDANDAVLLYNAVSKYDRGETLTPGEEALVRAGAIREFVNQTYETSTGYDIGKGTAVSVPFIVEMVVSGGATGAAVAGTKALLRRIGFKGAGKLATSYAGKAVRGVGKAAVAGATQAATVGLPKVVAGGTRRMMGNIRPAMDSEGNITYNGREGAESAAKAFAKEFVSNTLEYGSEHMGDAVIEPALRVLGGWAGKVGAALPEAIAKALPTTTAKLGLTYDRARAALGKIDLGGFQRDVAAFRKAAKLEGFVPEYLEELTNSLGDALFVGDQKIVGDDGKVFGSNDERAVFNWENQLNTALALIPMQLGFGSVSVGAHIMQRRATSQSYHKAEAELRNVLGDNAASVMEAIANAPDDRLAATVANAVRGQDTKTAQAITHYALSKAAYDNVRLIDRKLSTEAQDEYTTQDVIDTAYNDGVDAQTIGEQSDIFHNRMKARNSMQVVLDVGHDDDLDAAVQDAGGAAKIYEDALAEGDSHLARAAIQYANTEAAWQGVLAGVQERADAEIEAENKRIDGMADNDGVLHPVLLHSDSEDEPGERVYVVSGKVVGDENGVNADASDSMIILSDGRTIAPADIHAVLPAQDAAGVKEYRARYIQDEVVGEFVRSIEAWLNEQRAQATAMASQETEAEVQQEQQPQEQAQQPQGQYNMMDKFIVRTPQGDVPATIVRQADPDGRMLVRVDYPDGERIAPYTAEQLDGMVVEAPQGAAMASQETEEGQAPKPVGSGVFGSIYNQFKGKVKEAFDFLLKNKSGDILAVWSRDDVGDIDLVWGSEEEKAGVEHIITKHVGEGKDFANEGEMMSAIDDIVRNGAIDEQKSKWDKITLVKDGKVVVIRKNVRDGKGNVVDKNKNWVVTSFDNNVPKSQKVSAATPATPDSNEGGRAVAPDTLSADKDTPLQENLQAIPEEKRGKKTVRQYHKVPVERTLQDLYDGTLDQASVDAYVQAQIDEAQRDAKAASAKKIPVSTDLDAYKAAVAANKAQQADAEERAAYWSQVRDEVQRITKREGAESDDLLPVGDMEMDAYEYVASQFGDKGGIKITPESFYKETGYSGGEARKMTGVLAKAENGGVSIERAAEIIAERASGEGYTTAFGSEFFENDSSKIRDIILDILQEGNPRSYISRHREERARKMREAMENDRDTFCQEAFHMSYEEYREYESQLIPSYIEKYRNFDAQKFDELRAEADAERTRQLNEIYNDGTREGTGNGGSGEVLPAEGTADGAGSEIGNQRGAEADAGREGAAQTGAVPESAPAGEVGYQLSDEVDENGRQFVIAPHGDLAFGKIEAETGLTPAPILLSEGIITNPKTNDGYGLVHIEARHGEEIRKAGYASVLDFIEEVAQNYETIKEGNVRDGNQTYMLQLKDKHNNTLMVELSGDGTYWNINTAGIFKTSYGANRREVYNRHTTAKQSAETAEASLSGEQSGTTPSTSMNAPTSSAGKDNASSANEQGNGGKNADGYDELRRFMPEFMSAYHEWAESIGGERKSHDEAWKKYSALSNRLADMLKRMTDEQLNGIEEAFGEDYAGKLSEAVENEERRRREAASVSEAFDAGIAAQGALSKEVKAPKAALDAFTSTEELRPVMNGVYHDGEGYAVATDGRILIADKSQYDKKQKGKIVASHKLADGRKKGDVVEGTFPKWRSVIPSTEGLERSAFDFEGLRRFLAGAEDVFKSRWQREKEYGGRGSFASWKENAMVAIRMPNGEVCVYSYPQLCAFADAAVRMGMKEVYYGDKKPIMAQNNSGTLLLMPKMPTSITEYRAEELAVFHDASGAQTGQGGTPFSVRGAADYQKRLAAARTSAERAAVVKEYLDTIADGEDVVVFTQDSLLDELRKAGASQGAMDYAAEQIAKGNVIDGFWLGSVFINADAMTDIDHVRSKFVHERQHGITAQQKNSVYLQAVMGASTRDELKRIVAAMSKTDAYDKYSHRVLADEFISFAMEEAYKSQSDEELADRLRAYGASEELIDIIKSINNEQRQSQHLSHARQSVFVNTGQARGNRQDERDSRARPAGGLGQARAGAAEQGTERAGSRGEGEVAEPLVGEGRFSVGDREQRDREYAEAVERGDMEKVDAMLREEAARKGYAPDSDYQGTSAFNGAAPARNAYYPTREERVRAFEDETFEGDASLGDFMEAGLDVGNLDFSIHDERGLRTASENGRESILNLRGVVDGKKKSITMYRSVPADVEEGKFRNGDWVTPSRKYAEENADIHGWDDYRIIEQEVPVDDVWWDGNDINEWGYDDGKGYVYKNTENNRKLLEPTYDDAGNLIPLSERFNEKKGEARFSVTSDGKKAEMKKLNKASQFISDVLSGKTKQKHARVDLPEYVNHKAEIQLGHKIKSHRINANELVHSKKRHGINGTALTEKSIPLRDSDFALMPFVMTAPSRVRKGSTASDGTESVRYEKDLPNGIVIVVEREGRFDVEDMENITMWADKKPATYVTVAPRASHSTSETIVISEADIAKIKHDAEIALAKVPQLFESAKENAEKSTNNTLFRITPAEDAEYAKAVEAGDKAVMRRMVDEAAAKAMPDTKVVGKDGKPLVVYHGTTENFTVFDRTKGRRNMDIQGMFFSPWELDAQGYGENVRAFYLNIKNPAPFGVGLAALRKFQGQEGAGVKARELLISQGYDGVNNDNEEYIAFYPEQIKSADTVTYDDNGNLIPLSARFDDSNNDIRFSVSNANQRVFVSNAEKAATEPQQEEGLLFRDGSGEQVSEVSYEESLRRSKAMGYSKKQHDKWFNNYWQRITKIAEQYAKRLNIGDNVEVVVSADDLPATATERQRTAKGWYNPETGKIVVIPQNHSTTDGIRTTIMREGVAHHGLRTLFGEYYDNFIDNVYNAAEGSIREGIDNLAETYGDRRRATEEYLGRLAESTNVESAEAQSWWRAIKEWFWNVMQKLGFKDFDAELEAEGLLSDNELRYMLWRSYKNLVEPGEWRFRSLMQQAEDIDMRSKLGVGEYDEQPQRDEPQVADLPLLEGRYAEAKEKHPDAVILVQGEDGHYYTFGNDRDAVGKSVIASVEMDKVLRKLVEQGKRVGILEAQKGDVTGVAESGAEDSVTWVGDDGARFSVSGSDDYDAGHMSVMERADFERKKGAIERFNSKLGDTPIAIVHSKMSEKELFDALDFEDLLEEPFSNFEDGEVYELLDEIGQAWYDGGLKKICIFADRIPNDDTPVVVLHENIHALLDSIYGDKKRTICDAYYQKVDEYDRKRKLVEKAYDEEVRPEELFTYKLSEGLMNGHLDDAMQEVLNSEEGNTLLTNLYENINTDTRREGEAAEHPEGAAVATDTRGAATSQNTPIAQTTQIRSFIQGLSESLQRLASDLRNESDVRFSVSGSDDAQRVAARDAYEKALKRSAYQFTEAVQDSMLSLKKLYQAILAKGRKLGSVHIEDVEGYENAYLAENRLASATQAQQEEWHRRFMTPLLEAVNTLTGNDKKARTELADYMMAKHGLERNRIMAERDAQKEYDKKVAEGENPNLQDLIRKYRKRDYAGLTALTGETDVKVAEAAAQLMVDDYEGWHDTTELWQAVNAATKSSLEKTFLSGMMSRERYEQVRDMYEYYIPLQGFEEKTSDQVYAYFGGDGTTQYGAPIRTARGRKSKADDPIATIQMNGEAAIRLGNRNQMKMAFLAFVQSHPSDLVSVNDVWLRYNDATDEWELFDESGIQPGDDGATIARKIEDFNERMKQLAKSDPDHYKRGKDAPQVPYRVLGERMKEHQVLVRTGDRTYILTINGNPRAAQALNGLTNPDVGDKSSIGAAVDLGQRINRQLSAFYTTSNPEFVVSNGIRDLLYSNCMTWVKESPAYALKFHKNFAKMNAAYMAHLITRWENGTLDDSKYYQRMFKQFMLNGGETGFQSLRNIEKHKKEVEAEMKRMNSTSRKAWRGLRLCFEVMNRSVENCARFAAFVTSREAGRSIERSIWDAKEVSVNFNKKGAGDKFLKAEGQTRLNLKALLNGDGFGYGNLGAYVGGFGKALYVFFNAGVQGMNNIVRAAKRHPAKLGLGILSTNFALGAAIPLIMQAILGDDDDDDKDSYYNLPEYVRRSNICFRWKKDMPWVTIPLPIEFRAFYGLGELATSHITGKEQYDTDELTQRVVSQISQVLPLDFMEGGGGLHALIPSFAKPVVEAYTNKSWSGLPVYRNNMFKPYAPQWTLAYDSTNKMLVNGTKWLNEVTGKEPIGGDDYTQGYIDWNPARIQYMLNGYFGGWSTMTQKFMNIAEMIFGERKFAWRDIPIASRVLHRGDERTEARQLKNRYFKLKEEYDKITSRLRGYEKEVESDDDVRALEYAERLDFLNHSPQYARYQIFDAFKPMIDSLEEEKKAGGDKEALDAKETAIYRIIVGLSESVSSNSSENDAVSSQIDAALADYFNSGDATLRKKAASSMAKRLGGKDTYGSPDTEYGIRYEELRNPIDLAEDVILHKAQTDAKDAGNDERAKAIGKARKQLTDLKKGKHTKKEERIGLGEGTAENDAEIMEDIRGKRREIMAEFGIR